MLITGIGLGACSTTSVSPTVDQAEARRRLDLQRRCVAAQASLARLQDDLHRREQGLSALEQEVYRPAPPPTPLDPDEQRRLTIYDQEVEQEQYNQARVSWQEREEQRQALWQRQRQERLEVARQARATAAAVLRRQEVSLRRLGTCGARSTP